MNSITRHRAMAVVAIVGLAIAGLLVGRPDVFALPPGTAPSGTLHLNPQSGDSATTFQLVFDQLDSYCDGDGVAGYRWHTFITSASNDPATLTFAGSGSPSSAGVGYTQPLRTPGFNIIRQQTPTPQGTAGFINLSIDLSFGSPAYGATLSGSPALGGEFWVGLACSPNETGVTDEYWVGKIVTTPQDGAGPNSFTYAAATSTETTTTTTTTTSTSTTSTTSTTTTTLPSSGSTSTTTSSTVAGGSTSTSTVVDGSTSTSTIAESTTTSTTLPGATTSSTIPAIGAGATPIGGSGGTPFVPPTPTPQLAATGSSSRTLVAWALGLLVLGRIAILIGRTPKVIPSDRR